MSPRLPLRLDQTRWRSARWMVIAPHPDDETLGAGALMAEAAGEGRLAAIAFLTDGDGSHPHATHASRRRLAARRKREAADAVRRLTGQARSAPIFLGWPDGRPFAASSTPFMDTALRLAALVRRLRVDALAVTGGDERHGDHRAAFQLAMAVAARAIRPIAVFTYDVWPAAEEPGSPCFRTLPMRPGQRRGALAAHRSQLTPLMGEGFRIPAAMRKMPPADRLRLSRGSHAA